MSEDRYNREQSTYTTWQYVKATLALPLLIALVVLVLVGAMMLAVAAWAGLDAVIAASSGPCFMTAINATSYGTIAGYLSAVGMIVSGVGITMSLLMLCSVAMNENMHHALRRNLNLSIIGLLVSAAIVPLAGVMGCVAL